MSNEQGLLNHLIQLNYIRQVKEYDRIEDDPGGLMK